MKDKVAFGSDVPEQPARHQVAVVTAGISE